MSSCPWKSFFELTDNLTSAIAECDCSRIVEFVNLGDGAKWLLQWKLLANIRKRSADGLEKLLDHKRNEKELSWLLNNINFLELILCSGYVQEHKWIEVLEIMCRILAIDPAAKCGHKLRLAAAVALTFSSSVKSLADQRVEIDAVQRYMSFASWTDTNELFHHFHDLVTWQLRYVVGSWATDDELIWARENVPLEFKSPKNIGEATHSMMKYKETNEEGISVHDGASYYANRPVTMAVMHEVGAVCGGISKFGCAMAQAFGIPAMPVGQPGHCAYLWWKEGKWLLSNDVAGLKKSVIHDGIQWTWDRSAEFVLLMQHSQQSFEKFVLSEKIRIAAKFCSTGIALELLGVAIGYNSSNYLLWRDLAALCKNLNINRLNETWMLGMIEELDYFNQTGINASQLLSKGSTVKVSDCHDRGQNVVDGTGSEWWTSMENAWVEIDLGEDCIVTGVRIQWWGTSVSTNYIVYAAKKDGKYMEVRKTIDEKEKPVGYNGWSLLSGWTMKTAKVKFVLKDGSLDPWGMGKWIGIRQVQISGRRSRECKVLTKSKTIKMIGCQEVMQNFAGIFDIEFSADDVEAWVEVNLKQLCYLEKIEFHWKGSFSLRKFTLLTSVDGKDFKTVLFKAFNITNEVHGQTSLPINEVASVLKIELGGDTQSHWGMKKCFSFQNVMIYGEEILVKHLLIEKAKKELLAWPGVEDHVCSMLLETDLQLLSSTATCSTSDCHDRAQNIIDGTQSEWWSEHEDAWVELDLKAKSQIHGVRIQWWGTSVSRDLRVFIANEEGGFDKVRTSSDEIKSPVDYNDWSEFNGWDTLTKTIRFELNNGSLDPWGMGKYFGIRQIIVTGYCCS